MLALGEHVRCENIYSASQMSKAVEVFLREQNLIKKLIQTGI